MTPTGSGAVRHRLLALAVLAFAACADGTGSRDVARAPVTVSGVLTPEQQALVAGMSVEVTGPGIGTAIIADLAVDGATLNGTVTVPVGPNRSFTVRAYDAAGTETYAGSATASVVAGTNPPLAVRLLAREGSVPIDVTIASFGVTLAPATVSVAVDAEVTLTATVTAAGGGTVTGTPTWGVLNPALVAVTVAPDGRSAVVRGRIVGSTRVVVSYEGVAAASTVVTVDPSPPTGNLAATRVSAGFDFSCALTNAGIAYCWGANDVGQLGNGTTTGSARPVAVRMPAGVTFTTLRSGSRHSCAEGSDGSVYCWGGNEVGQLGLGDLQPRTEPAAVPAETRPGTMGYSRSCNLRSGTYYCWGAGYGPTPVAQQAPSGSTVHWRVAGGSQVCMYVHVAIPNPPFSEQKIIDCPDAGGQVTVPQGVTMGTLFPADGYACHNYASQGGMRCFGSNGSGQWGTGMTGGGIATLTSYLPVAFGTGFTCSLSSCSGANGNGQLGSGSTASLSLSPVAIAGGSMAAIAVSAGGTHACGVRGGNVYCWGNNGSGQLGDGTVTLQRSPVAVVSPAP